VRDRSVAVYLISTTEDRGDHASPRSRTGCAPATDPTAGSTTRCAAQRHEPLPNPLCGGEGWSIRPRRGARQGCRALFVRAGARSKSPAAPHGLAGRSPDSATRGAFLFGYFLLGTQEKVTRAAAAGRMPAAGEPSREYTQLSHRELHEQNTSNEDRRERLSRTGCAPTGVSTKRGWSPHSRNDTAPQQYQALATTKIHANQALRQIQSSRTCTIAPHPTKPRHAPSL